ncbi:MAG: hypothetical protein WDM70_00595 [Nitrosomonadales bacterium]
MNFVTGFVGNPPKPSWSDGHYNFEWWDGHIICRAGDHFIDAALHHFNVETGRDNVPVVAVSKIIHFSSQVISRMDPTDHIQLWWHHPPKEVDLLKIPQSPQELITKYSSNLINRLLAQHMKYTRLSIAKG